MKIKTVLIKQVIERQMKLDNHKFAFFSSTIIELVNTIKILTIKIFFVSYCIT